MKIHWLPLTLDAGYVRDAANLAKAYGGVTGFHLSHRLVHNADDVMEDTHRLAKVQEILKGLKESGFEVWCWTHEVKNPPAECVKDGVLDLDHPQLPTYLEEKYRRFLHELLPGLDGLVLTFAETQFEVYKAKNVSSREHTGPDAPARKTRWLVHLMREICRRHGVDLAIRDFVYRLGEIEEMLEAIGAVEDDVAVMSKCVPHDWQPYYPENPVLGRVGAKAQWIEFDLGHEYEMQTVLPFAEPELLYRRAQAARALGIDTFCLRLDRYGGAEGDSAVYKPWGQLELMVFSRIAADPQVTLGEILSDWEREHFPGAWQVLGIATEVVRRMLFPQKLWLADHSNLPTYKYAKSHLKGGNADRLPVWTHSPVDALAEALCDRPTPEWYAHLVAAEQKNHFYLSRIDLILEERGLVLEEGSPWHKGLAALKAWEELFRLYKQAYFSLRLYECDPDSIGRNEVAARIDRLEEACDRYKAAFPVLKLTGEHAWKAHGDVVASLRQQLS